MLTDVLLLPCTQIDCNAYHLCVQADNGASVKMSHSTRSYKMPAEATVFEQALDSSHWPRPCAASALHPSQLWGVTSGLRLQLELQAEADQNQEAYTGDTG